MSRPLRITFPGAIYHMTSRGNAQAAIYADDADRQAFLDLLTQIVQRYHWLCHAYSLMDNHYHLLIETPEGNLSQGARQLNGVYTQQFNRRHGRVGHVFQGRYKAILVEKDRYLLELCRYVVRNPVRTERVRSAREYRWSSYRATAGLSATPELLCTDWLLAQFGGERSEAQRQYRRFVAEGVKRPAPWEGATGTDLPGPGGLCGRDAGGADGGADAARDTTAAALCGPTRIRRVVWKEPIPVQSAAQPSGLRGPPPLRLFLVGHWPGPGVALHDD